MPTQKDVQATLPRSLLRTAGKIARAERRSTAAVLAEALRQYESDLTALRQAQDSGVRAARASGVRTMREIDRLVHEVRRERRARRS